MVIAPIPRTVEADSRRAPAVTAPMAEAAVAVAVGRSTASTVWSLFSSRARVHPDRVAVQDGDSQLTYQELERRASRLGSALAAHGMVRGGRIAVLSENRVEYLEVVLAAARIGALVACQN
ncbi:MAG: AMP-binding protein, partial [Actinomycetia bacterium]|nr:AMP-binding protein [Actinomycetes bacterium]